MKLSKLNKDRASNCEVLRMPPDRSLGLCLWGLSDCRMAKLRPVSGLPLPQPPEPDPALPKARELRLAPGIQVRAGSVPPGFPLTAVLV